MARRPAPSVGPAPTAATLRERALAHLARYTATEAGLARVLARGVDRWARRAAADGADTEQVATQAAAARATVRGVVTQLAAAGAVSDVAFAESRARSLLRGGRSRRAVAAHLVAKGVGAETAKAVLETGENDELSAALVLARRRRIGPFREAEEDRKRELAMLARAGFNQDVASRALRMGRDEAEAIVLQLRRS
ncbi:MAG TPA: RecX family transcriptional regulator [Acetobacteraceae bacterium]|jgi:regulatory protein|nr:RecX family transcriptional regulator [Acetobacteraceae bacterium]